MVPVVDEVETIDDVLGDLLAQDYEGFLEVLVADGGSTDGTLQRLEWWADHDSRVKVLHNTRRGQAFGLNHAAEVALGTILVRADGHSRYGPAYVSRSVQALHDLGGAVGGPMTPAGISRFGRAVTAAMKSPLTMGPGRFHHATTREEEVDTVYLGAFLKSDFDDLGGFRPFPSGTSEDADFYFRWRMSGRKVHIDPAIESVYRPRDHAGRLWRQYFRYGLGKAEMLWLNRKLPSLRPWAPVVLVVLLISALVLALTTGVWWPFILGAGGWLLLLVGVGVHSDVPPLGVVVAAAIMHLAYGVGMMWGLLRGPGPIRHLQSAECDTNP